jgi:putative hydrolase of the HAD superfamily
MFRRVRLICFDLDDTLWPCQPVIRAAEAECYRWLERKAPRLTARYSEAQLREHRMTTGRSNPQIAHDLTEVRLRSLATLLAAEGYGVSLARQACDVFRGARNRVTPYGEVVEALDRLRRKYTLVSVTNGNSQIERTPLHASFDYSLTAAEVGSAKPDPEIFHVASRRGSVPLEAFLHVGDDPLRDVQAAREIGLPTVWVNRKRCEWPTDLLPADLEVENIAELADRLLV